MNVEHAQIEEKKSDAVSTDPGIDSPFTVDAVQQQQQQHRTHNTYHRAQNTEYSSIGYTSILAVR